MSTSERAGSAGERAEMPQISRAPWGARRVGNTADGNKDADVYIVYSAKGKSLSRPLFRHDACLIKSAPDLLTTLIALVGLHGEEVFVCGSDDEDRVAKALSAARAAIARATGAA